METILYLTTFAALVGAYFNVKGRWCGFLIWTFTNAIFFTHNVKIEEYHQAGLFFCYLCLSAYGMIRGLRENEHN